MTISFPPHSSDSLFIVLSADVMRGGHSNAHNIIIMNELLPLHKSNIELYHTSEDEGTWMAAHLPTNSQGQKSNLPEPYLTFLNIPQLERQGTDMKTRVEELEMVNQSLRNRGKLKNDAIAQLSDQLMVISTRLQEVEDSSLCDV